MNLQKKCSYQGCHNFKVSDEKQDLWFYFFSLLCPPSPTCVHLCAKKNKNTCAACWKLILVGLQVSKHKLCLLLPSCDSSFCFCGHQFVPNWQVKCYYIFKSIISIWPYGPRPPKLWQFYQTWYYVAYTFESMWERKRHFSEHETYELTITEQ